MSRNRLAAITVFDSDQAEPGRRSRRTGSVSGTSFEERLDVRRLHPAGADLDERPDDRTHHVTQESGSGHPIGDQHPFGYCHKGRPSRREIGCAQ